jgi:hypothetical protein
VPDKAILADCHQFANEGMRLHPRARADCDALLDLGKWADEAIVTDPAAVQIARLDNSYPRAENDATHT